jgi:hypothetical protein
MKTKYKKWNCFLKPKTNGLCLRIRQKSRSLREMSLFRDAVRLSERRNKHKWHLRLKFGFD